MTNLIKQTCRARALKRRFCLVKAVEVLLAGGCRWVDWWMVVIDEKKKIKSKEKTRGRIEETECKNFGNVY